MVHTRFSSVSRSPSKCASASKGKSKMSPKEVAMKKSKLKGKRKKTNFTIQYNVIAPPKGMQYVIPVEEHETAKLHRNNKYEQISDLVETLSVKQLAEFRASCFGNFTHLRPFKIQYQLIHNLLLRQLKQPDPLEICDSGIYMVSFAEYLADKKEIPQGDLDIGAHRSRLGFLFYSYGMAKQICGYESEGEDKKRDEKAIKTPTKKRKTRSMK
ncbi:hypothetical protein DCAR_0934522 [Daucus carota subsp. sativus]|uniref:Uncharacterized protein n=1 Tax=Daucus carota subsp. sativus TaxID=79200 RepID=A0AAF1BFJ2_DAUCS|nr:PREDICTED: uncharacterized protein LOC108201306 [Daucus carota subsp. sativus]WOH14992.1 hypothetical protein DCAR_0934522 [Daucus carota subsp. sativus]